MEKWLSISEAAKILGVHPTTLRLWTKKGTIPFHRTSGGHRRFLEEELRIWSDAHRGTFSPESIISFSLRQARTQIKEANLMQEGWYQKLDERARETYQKACGFLLDSMYHALTASDDENRLEAQAIGYEHASRALRFKLSEMEALQAFLFFRSIALNAIGKAYRDLMISPVDVIEQLHKLLTFTDWIMFALVDAYHQLGGHAQPKVEVVKEGGSST
ncbi:MAG: helix-turn-helix domain-containing protein [Anaerolineales bacterium]